MWTSGRLSRTNSVQSTTRSVSSTRSPAIPEDNAIDRKIAMWSTSQQEPQQFPSRLSRTASSHSIASISTTSQASSVADDAHPAKFDWTVSPVSRISVAPKHDWTMSPVTQIDVSSLNILPRRDSFSSMQSKSTLAEEGDHELDLKTPTATRKVMVPTKAPAVHAIPAPSSEEPAGPPAGPLEAQLLAILSKVRLAEKSQPTVMAADYKELQDRVAALEAEKATWQRRHEALHALRDEDLANLIKVRGMLAKERREHDGLKKLRDDDLKNVLELRGKLARMTWNRARGASTSVDMPAEQQQQPQQPQQRSSSRGSVRSSMREGSDLWQAAKTAALEQRLLEMEHANAELKKQLDDTVAQKAVLQQQAVAAPAPVAHSPATMHPASMGAAHVAAAPAAGMGKVEHLLAETVRHRERASVKVHELRTENETLRKTVARLEDRASELEDTVHRLQKWA